MSAIAVPFLGKSMSFSVFFSFTCCTFFPVLVLIAFLLKSVLVYILLFITSTAFMPVMSAIAVPFRRKFMSCFYNLLFHCSAFITCVTFSSIFCTCRLCCEGSSIPVMCYRNFFFQPIGFVIDYLVSVSHCITFDGDVF